MAALLLAFARQLIDGSTPLHFIESSTPGTGKGLLVQVLAIPAMRSGPTTVPGDLPPIAVPLIISETWPVPAWVQRPQELAVGIQVSCAV